MTNKELCLIYLKRYAEKDLLATTDMFADNIMLRDWKISVRGKSAALVETRKNFESVDTIQIKPLFLYENHDTVAAELKIIINDRDELYVVDVIKFNSLGKIQSIHAYLGKGDD